MRWPVRLLSLGLASFLAGAAMAQLPPRGVTPTPPRNATPTPRPTVPAPAPTTPVVSSPTPGTSTPIFTRWKVTVELQEDDGSWTRWGVQESAGADVNVSLQLRRYKK